METVEPAMYVLPKEAIADLAGLPRATTPEGDCIVLIFRRFKARLRHIPIVLTDLPIPPSLTANAGGVAVLTATGTQAEIGEPDPELVAQVQDFLRRKLDRYELSAQDLAVEDAIAL